ncbi:MAG: hypothetical protein AAF702_06125 [Chloroflexota bacterium]
MMTLITALAGSAVAAGVGFYAHFTRTMYVPSPASGLGESKQPIFRKIWLRQPKSDSTADPDDQVKDTQKVQRTNHKINHGLLTSSISLSVATTGFLVFPPLRYASIPTLVYMGIPSAQDAYDNLYNEGNISAALIETATLTICLGSGYFWLGSVSFLLYYIGRALVHKEPETEALYVAHEHLFDTARLLINDNTVDTPITALQSGDRIVVLTSEIVPADGIIVDGTAWVRAGVLTDVMPGLLKRVGDKVSAADIVVIGNVTIQVIKDA